MNANEIIYVDVTGYPEKLWQPVEAQHQHGSCFLVLESSADPEHEYWQFQSGDVVHCEMNEFYEGETGLFAVSKCQCKIQ
jgi:hypothetical protein